MRLPRLVLCLCIMLEMLIFFCTVTIIPLNLPFLKAVGQSCAPANIPVEVCCSLPVNYA